MIMKFALRNLLRNRKRSLLTIMSIFLAAIVVGLAQGWINGMINVYFDNFIRYQLGHLRITTEEFVKREKFMPVDEIIFTSDNIIKKVEGMDKVKSVKERVRFGILLARKNTTIQAVGMGIDLDNNLFKLKEKLISGRMTDSGIYIGKKLAEKLGVSQGEELLLATRTSEGGLNGIKLKVDGIFQFKMMFDKMFFFISLADAKKLLKIYEGTTEIFVYSDSNDIEQIENLAREIRSELPEGLAVKTYKEQMGNLYSTMENNKIIYAFIETIILFLASFVIINTMMMAIFERLREIGALKALGMTDRELFLNFTCEGAILGAVGGFSGAAIGYLIVVAIAHFGIDYSIELQDMDMPIEYIIRPVVEISDLAVAVAMSIIVPALSAMIPARYARRLMPAEALRK